MEEWFCNSSSDWARVSMGPLGLETFNSRGLAGAVQVAHGPRMSLGVKWWNWNIEFLPLESELRVRLWEQSYFIEVLRWWKYWMFTDPNSFWVIEPLTAFDYELKLCFTLQALNAWKCLCCLHCPCSPASMGCAKLCGWRDLNYFSPRQKHLCVSDKGCLSSLNFYLRIAKIVGKF